MGPKGPPAPTAFTPGLHQQTTADFTEISPTLNLGGILRLRGGLPGCQQGPSGTRPDTSRPAECFSEGPSGCTPSLAPCSLGLVAQKGDPCAAPNWCQGHGKCVYVATSRQLLKRGRCSCVPAVPSHWGSVLGAASEGPHIPPLCPLPSIWSSSPGHGPITPVGIQSPPSPRPRDSQHSWNKPKIFQLGPASDTCPSTDTDGMG